MNAGELKEVILVEEPETDMGTLQSPDITYREAFRTRAKVETPGTSRRIDNAELFFSATAVFRVRQYHRITNGMRIRWRGDAYRIIGIERDDRRMQLVIKTELANE